MKFQVQVGVVAVVSAAATVFACTSPAFAKDVVGPKGEAVSGQYVVVLKDSVRTASVSTVADSLVKGVGAKKGLVYSHALKGFSVQATPGQAKRLLSDARVGSVYQDGVVRASGDVSADAVSQPAPSWGLDRIDQRALPDNHYYRYNVTAPNVRAYVIDTGIRTTHTQFGGRASVGADFVGDGWKGQDCAGHGTHVAGTIGGSAYGVAKSVKLVSVRVLDCNGFGYWSQVIAGVDWVTAHAAKPAVANMSLGGSWYWPLDLAVHRSIESGVTYVVAAGNSNVDACNTSPADVLSAITVGATGTDSSAPASDSRAYFSNYGACLDVFAPGVRITSAWNSSNTAVNTISGTSMASPHVAGVAALYLSMYPTANPMTVRNALVGLATKGRVVNPGSGSPNALLYTYLRPETRITLDATPEPVHKGGTVTLRGKLTKDGVAFAGQTVYLYFTPSGGARVYKGTAVTGSTGLYARAFTQSVTGTWTVIYPAKGVIIGSSAVDPVAIG